MEALKEAWAATSPGKRAAYGIVLLCSAVLLAIMIPGAYRVVVPRGPAVLEASPEARAEIEDFAALDRMVVADLRTEVKARQAALSKAEASKDAALVALARAALSRASDSLFTAQASGRP